MKTFQFKSTRNFEFELNDLGKVVRQNSSLTGVPHRAEFYQIICNENGYPVHTVDFNPIQLQPGQFLFISKNQVVTFDVQTDYRGQLILFTDRFYNRCECDNRFLQQVDLFNPFVVNHPLAGNHSMQQLWDLMKDEYAISEVKNSSHILHSLLETFLSYAKRIREKDESVLKNDDYKIALRFVKMVEQHFRTYRKVSDYTGLLNVSSKILTRALKTVLGKTPKQWIEEQIVLEARRLLIYENQTIKEITWALGFDEPTNFSKFFRHQTGQTPQEFKKQFMA